MQAPVCFPRVFLEEDNVQPSLLELVAEEFLSPMEGQCIERRELETEASCTSAGAYWCRLREAGRRHWVRRLIGFIEQGLVSREGWRGVEFVPQPGEARMPEQLEKSIQAVRERLAFRAALATWSASSLPGHPVWLGIQSRRTGTVLRERT